MASAETLWGLARAVLIGVLVSILLIRMFEERFIFFPDIAVGGFRPEGFGVRVEDVWLTASDGVRLHAWWASAEGAAFTVLLLHGNAGNLTHRVETIGFLQQLPASVLALDYRGFGRSQGRPTEEGVYHDAEAAYDYLVGEPESGGRGLRPEQIVVLGQSLGTAVAVDLASKRPVAALVLEAGFPSAQRVAQQAIPLPGVAYIIRTRFDSDRKLKGIRVPVLVTHCQQDSVMPYKLGEELYAAANEPKTFVSYPGACHEPLFFANPSDYAGRLRDFLARLPRS
ncbi:MAG: alpha/beta hydrolase [Candidatus Acidiferrales bacterium]